jgi:subfamily B ATP-binding cassette protein HlyB/CyaB
VRELEHIRQFLTGPALMSVIDLAFTGVFIAVMLYYSPLLTLIVCIAIPCYVVLMVCAMPLFRRRLDEKFTRGAENQAFLVESVTNIQTLKAGATEPQAVRRWDEQLAAYVAASFRVTRLSAFAGEGIQLIQKLVTVGILWLGALEVMDGAMTVGGLVAFNMLAGRVAQPVVRLAQLWQDLQQTGVSVARLGDILNTRTENSVSGARTQLPQLRGAIEFDQVRFRYRPDGPEVVRGVSFRIQPGEILGMVGRSGSGKSTVAKLIQRLYVPERGRVLADGIDLALADPAWLRRQIGVVLQENRLFARSVRENIALADPGAPMEAVIQVAKLAGAHEFILELPEGYDTLVGEQGATLSGGQRQRIAIARALMTNPRILIFDEATSALDYESERVIQDNMRFIAKGRTLIVIAHRLTAVRDAHRILVMEAGEIVEQGAHAELVKRPEGRYARLHAMQAS